MTSYHSDSISQRNWNECCEGFGGWREKIIIVHGSHWKGSPARVRLGLGHSWDHPDVENTQGVAATKPVRHHGFLVTRRAWVNDKFLSLGLLGQGAHVGTEPGLRLLSPCRAPSSWARWLLGFTRAAPTKIPFFSQNISLIETVYIWVVRKISIKKFLWLSRSRGSYIRMSCFKNPIISKIQINLTKILAQKSHTDPSF